MVIFEEQCVIIWFLHLHGMKPIEIHQQLSETCNDGIMDVKNMCSWVQQFTEGRTSCENKPREPPPHTSWSEDMIAWVECGYGRPPHDCETDSCQCRHIRWICGHHLAWRPEIAESFCGMGSTWRRLLWFVFTRRSALCELLYPQTHIFHVHNAIIACLTQLLMNFDGSHATLLEESDNHALLFECKRHHFQYLNTTVTLRRHKHSTHRTMLPFGLTQPKEQPHLLQQLSCFYLLSFPRKKLGDLRPWTHHVLLWNKSGRNRKDTWIVLEPLTCFSVLTNHIPSSWLCFCNVTESLWELCTWLAFFFCH
jgi:hypothetical protein